MPMSDIYNFKERRYCAYRHRLKVFIFGVDVSPWLRGNVNITYGNRDSFNTASLEISNPRRIWQITRANLENPETGFRTGAGEYDESRKRDVFKNKHDINQDYTLITTKAQFGSVETTPASINPKGSIKFTPTADDKERKYRFAVNDCIFNKHDPIRIFAQNPLNPASTEWMEVFCGFVQDHPVTTDYFNGSSFVRITANCIRHMMTKMRVQTNAIQQGNTGDIFFNASFFADFSKPTNLSQPFAQASLETTIKELILGSGVGSGFSANASSGSMSTDSKACQARGVGEFSLGNVVCYDPKNPGNALERWHLMTMFGCNKVPFPGGEGAVDFANGNLAPLAPQTQDLWLSNKQANDLGAETIWHPKRKYRGPDARYLHFLLPIGGTGASALTESTVATGPQQAEFTTRWEIIKSFAEKLDFQVTTSPSGDILVEFPMYGFTPAAFSPQGVNHEESKGKGKKTQDKSGLENFFTFELHQKEETLNDEGEDFPTVLVVTGGNASTYNNPTNNNFPPRSFIYSPVLASRYGVIAESVDYPFAGQTASDLGGSLVTRLSRLGMIEYTKRLAHSSTWEGTVAYRPLLFPNRPLHLKRSNRIGNVTSVTYQWNIGKDAGVSLAVNNLMAERYNGDNGQSSFRLITGSLNVPISYSELWGSNGAETGADAAFPSSGVMSPATNNVGSPGAAQSAAPEQPASPGQVRERITNPPATRDLGTLYPRFRKLIEQLIEECAKQGISVSVREAFRSPERQQEIFNKAKGVGTNAEAFQSWHQYGLAVDLVPKLDKSGALSNDRAALARVNDIQNQLGLGLRWGGSFRSFYDGWHFEKPTSWINLKTARAYVTKYSKDYLEYVWKHIDATVFGEASAAPLAKPVATGTGAVPGKPASPPPSAGKPTATPCSPRELDTAGFEMLPEDPE